MSTNLNEWIIQEINDRGWSVRELARRADLVHGTINSVLAEKSRPGPTFCTSIARAFREPPERIFRMAGLLPPVIIGKEREQELLDSFRYLSKEDQDKAIAIVQTLYRQSTVDDTQPTPKVEE